MVENKLLKGGSEELTYDQQLAIKSFSDWLDKTYDSTPYVLSGYAGSGKTFLSVRFLKLVEDLGLCWTVVAPTHKAVGVLRQALDLEGLKPIWHPSTIHRLLRLKLKRKRDLEVCEKTEQTLNSLEQLGLVLIDEASMIDSSLLEILFQCAHPYRTRLVFVGDPAQLPPVGETHSPVFSLERARSASLNQVVRHQGVVLQLANSFRDSSLPCQSPPCLPMIEDGRSSVGCLDQKSWLMQAKDALRSASARDNPDAVRILCYTNKTLENLVPHARRAIHGEMADQLVVLPGEVLISRSAVMAPASRDGIEGGEEPDMVLGSNRELIVSDVKPERCDLSEFGLSCHPDWDVPVIDTFFVEASCGEMSLSLRLLPALGTEGRYMLDSTLERLKVQAKEVGKDRGRIIWRQFFLVRDAFASLGPAAVLTVHRSQGSTFGEVFIASDVFWPKDLILRRQLVYVAVSRAKTKVSLVGFNVEKLSIQCWQRKFGLI